MLTTCKECGLQVSDKAFSCPHCGYPLQEAANSRKYQQRSVRHRRLPNGFGQITKLKDPALRNPFRAMVTVGKTETGRPICKLLKPVSYFKTYNEAYEALVEYSKARTNKTCALTVSDVFEEWYKEFSDDGRSKSYLKAVIAAWKHCDPIKAIPISEIKSRDVRDCIIEAKTSSAFKARIKHTLSMMFDYAVSLEYLDRNPVKMFRLPKAIESESLEVTQPHLSFSEEEIDKLWSNTDDDYTKMILIQCYSGWRPGELVDLRVCDVNIKDWTFSGGMKTKAGKDRIVPIHSKVKRFVSYFYEKANRIGCEYLFVIPTADIPCSYAQYYRKFSLAVERLGLNEDHRPHDPRKFFVTEAKRKNMDDYAIKRIIGHSIEDITETVYTERDIEWLRQELEKI